MWLLPSRSRPANVKRAVEIYPEVDMVLWKTVDDPLLYEYDRIKVPERWKVVTGPAGARTAEIFNYFYSMFPEETYYGFIGDDVVPGPEGWDRKLQEAAGEMYIAYPEDSIQGSKLCPHFCIGGDLVRHVNHFAFPGIQHSFLDQIWYTLGDNADLLRYVPEVKFHHIHPLSEEVEVDEVYVRGQETLVQDKRVFNCWLRFQAKAMVKDLKEWKNEREAATIRGGEELSIEEVAAL